MICPDCGGKIKQTTTTVKKTSEGEPTKIKIRVGCENCEYTEHEDYEDL